jgi:hypothetical protein
MNKYKDIWITREGEPVPIKLLEDDHLVNIIKGLRRNVAQYRESIIHSGYQILGGVQGEMAVLSIESDLMQLESISDDEFLAEYMPCYKNLVKEAKERKLVI